VSNLGCMEESPPADADEWSDEEWLAWLSETDGSVIDPATPGPVTPASDKLPVGGQLLYAGMRGLFEVIYGHIEQPAIVIEASGGDPEEPESLEVHLDPEHPEDSTVMVRPWLFEGDSDLPST
jgi:hypothetical protein